MAFFSHYRAGSHFSYHPFYLVQTPEESGGAVAQSVERATPVEEVVGSIPTWRPASLLVGLVSIM